MKTSHWHGGVLKPLKPPNPEKSPQTETGKFEKFASSFRNLENGEMAKIKLSIEIFLSKTLKSSQKYDIAIDF